jgi:ribosomal protein S12 methylthiotransferase
MYLQPAELTDELLRGDGGAPKVASYFDLSLQHVSGPVVGADGPLR